MRYSFFMRRLFIFLGMMLASRDALAVFDQLLCADGSTPPCNDVVVPDIGDYEMVYDCSKKNTAWTAAGNNIVTRTVYTGTAASSALCTTSSTQISCAAGYYGSPTSASNSSACTQCPANGRGLRGTSNPGSNTGIYGCYIADGTYTDNYGTVTYDTDCDICPPDEYWCSDESVCSETC